VVGIAVGGLIALLLASLLCFCLLKKKKRRHHPHHPPPPPPPHHLHYYGHPPPPPPPPPFKGETATLDFLEEQIQISLLIALFVALPSHIAVACDCLLFLP
jgi:hypothetical protein